MKLYSATISYVRSWWATDGVRLPVTRLGLDGVSLRSIAVEYNVNRGIRRSQTDGRKAKDDYVAIELAGFLNKERKCWPESLEERAEQCCNLLDRASCWLHGSQISAITKFMWFLNPDDWTVYDRFAADGAGISKSLPTKVRMKQFYGRLAEWEFVPTTRKMQDVIDAGPLSGLPAPRILDRFLMARSEDFKSDTEDEIARVLAVLPEDARLIVTTLADQLQRTFGDDVLPMPARKLARKKAAAW